MARANQLTQIHTRTEATDIQASRRTQVVSIDKVTQIRNNNSKYKEEEVTASEDNLQTVITMVTMQVVALTRPSQIKVILRLEQHTLSLQVSQAEQDLVGL